jgi:hypothetical protein
MCVCSGVDSCVTLKLESKTSQTPVVVVIIIKLKFLPVLLLFLCCSSHVWMTSVIM